MLLAAAGQEASFPLEYLADLVARRYGIPPWELGDVPLEDITRALHFMNVEAQARKEPTHG